jgi:predicted PurR-regulated permease PerM
MQPAAKQDAGETKDGVSAPVAVIASAAEKAADATPPQRAGFAAVGLLALAVLYTLYIARVLILPIVLAILLSLILWPIVRGLRRLRIPEALGALIVLLGLTGVFGYGAYALSGPAASWFASAPEALRRMEQRLKVVKETVADVQQATTRVEQMATVGDPPPRVVAVASGGLSSLLLASTWEVLASLGVIFILTYFLLASGDLFLRKCLRALPTRRDRQLLLEMARELQDNISGYLLTVALINLGVGVGVAIAMFVYGLPNPLLWGAIAFAFNFVPYIGATVGIICVFAASLITFDTLGQALAPPLTYLGICTVEAYIVTPLALSHRFTLNPVIVLIALLFWGWIWGIPGALIAMPILMTAKIVCDYVPSFATVGEFLSN